MGKEQDGAEYLDDFVSSLAKFKTIDLLGEDLQTGIRLSQTARGARTNARIKASQAKEGFDETETAEDELNDVEDDITNELLNIALENLFGE